jgi:bacteriocin-like protein
MKEENLVSKKHSKEQPTLSTDSLLETSKKGDIELTEQELAKVSGGKFTTTTKDKVDTYLAYN